VGSGVGVALGGSVDVALGGSCVAVALGVGVSSVVVGLEDGFASVISTSGGFVAVVFMVEGFEDGVFVQDRQISVKMARSEPILRARIFIDISPFKTQEQKGARYVLYGLFVCIQKPDK
jgi:hypothetical protein